MRIRSWSRLPFCSSDRILERKFTQDPRVLHCIGHSRPAEPLPDYRRRKKSDGNQARICHGYGAYMSAYRAKILTRFAPCILVCIPHQRHVVQFDSKRNGDIRYPRGSIMRERITMDRIRDCAAPAERCGQDVGRPGTAQLQIQRSCPCPGLADPRCGTSPCMGGKGPVILPRPPGRRIGRRDGRVAGSTRHQSH